MSLLMPNTYQKHPCRNSSSSAGGGGGGGSGSSSAWVDTSTPSRPSSTSNSVSIGGKGGGEALLIREGAVYRCTAGPDDLPGLRAWVMAKVQPTLAIHSLTPPYQHTT